TGPRLQCGPGGQIPARAVRAAGPPCRPTCRAKSLSAGRARHSAGSLDRPDRSGSDRVRGSDEPGRRARGDRGAGAGLSRAPEFITLSDAASRAVAGANSRHAALIEDAFDVLVETPGGGVSLTGDAKGRAAAKKAVHAIAERADQGLEIAEADVRVAIGNARSGGAGPGALPVGRRGQVAPKTKTQAEY